MTRALGRTIARRRLAIPLFFVLIAVSLGPLAGCGGKDDVVTQHLAPDVIAVTAADSVATGQGLDVKIHWRSTGTCQTFEGVAFDQINDSTFSAVAFIKETRDPDQPCTARDTILEGGFVLRDPPARAFRLVVYGANQQDTVFVQGGAAPSAIERHVIEIENASNGAPVQGGEATYVDLNTQAVFATLTTDSFGLADTAMVCAGTTRPYKISLVGASGRRATLVFQSRPQRCGVPEKTWIRF